MPTTHSYPIGNILARGVFLILVNITLMAIIGYLTLDVYATLHSRIGALLLSFFIPAFIVFKTPHLSGMRRVIRYGAGFMIYFILALAMIGPFLAITTWLFPCLLLAIVVLNFGDLITGLQRE